MEINLNNYYEVLDVLFEAMPFVFWKDRNGIYLGGNQHQARAFGFHTPADFIGKTIFDILDDRKAAKAIDNVDNKIMRNGKARIIEETISTPFGEKTYLSQKNPVKDSNGNVIGLLGFAMDVTELKKYEILAKRQQADFKNSVGQMVHDIRSPLSSLQMIVQSTNEIPEQKRITLRRTAINIADITNQLLNQYSSIKPQKNNERQILLVSTFLAEILSDRRYKYKDTAIEFEYKLNQDNAFFFVKASPMDLKRAITNIINNAVESIESTSGKIEVKLAANEEWVHVSILDNGKGIPANVLKKITDKVSITHGKTDGHGIGMLQIQDAVENNHGKFDIFSSTDKRGHGTTIRISLPRVLNPDWISEEIGLQDGDLVMVLDDDISIHGAWDSRLEHIVKKLPSITIKHFNNGEDAIAFVKKIPPKKYPQTCFLSDYELIGQKVNGLDVITKCKIKRSILVTSHYTNLDIRREAVQHRIKILPKELVHIIPINIIQDNKQNKLNVHLVFVDDDKSFTKGLIANYYLNLVVDSYSNPLEFLDVADKYAKDTRIILDNYYYMEDGGTYNIDGVTMARELHAKGFNNLILLSGEEFPVPQYLTLILKTDQDRLSELDKL